VRLGRVNGQRAALRLGCLLALDPRL